MRKIVILFLILAPLIDYTHNLHIISVLSIEVSPNRVYKFLPVIFLIYAVPLAYEKMFLWKYAVILLFVPILTMATDFFVFPGESVDTYIRLLSSFIFIFIAGKVLMKTDFNLIFRYVFFISFIPIVMSYLQFFGIVPYVDFDDILGIWVGRVSGGYKKQVAMMAYLLYGYSYAIFSFFHSKNKLAKYFYIIYILLSFSIIILSTHRASMIIFILITIYFLFIYARKFLIAFLFGILFVSIKYSTLINAFLWIPFGFSKVPGAPVFRGRGGIWNEYLKNLFSSDILSILIGKGHPVLKTFVISTGYLQEPHSDFVRILYQYGVLGFFIFMMVLFSILKRSIYYRKHSLTLDDKLIGDLGIIIGIAILLYSVTIEPTRFPSYWWYYSALASYILINWRKLRLNAGGLHNKPVHSLQI